MNLGDRSFRLRYVGRRFDGARLPLEVLADLPAFRDLLAAYAKDLWRLSHAERQRLPKGFDQSLSFDMVALEEGSAMPMIDWSRAAAQSYLPGFGDELSEIVDTSFHEIVRLIDNAATGKFPKSLSSEHIRALNKLGSGLRSGERIEFLGSTGGDGDVVYLDTYRRKSLITHVRETYQARFEGLGVLKGLHLDGQVSVQTEEYGEIKIAVDPDRIAAEFDGNMGAAIQFSLKIELDNNDNFRNVVETYDIDLVDAELSDNIMKCRERLNDLRSLRPGWLDGTGVTLTGAAIGAAERFLKRRPSHSGAYRIYPTVDGGVVFEFENDGWDYSVEFSPQGKVEMYGIEIGGVAELEPRPFDDVDGGFLDFFDTKVQR